MTFKALPDGGLGTHDAFLLCSLCEEKRLFYLSLGALFLGKPVDFQCFACKKRVASANIVSMSVSDDWLACFSCSE